MKRFCDITRNVYCRSNNPKNLQDCLKGYISRSDYFLDESECKQTSSNGCSTGNTTNGNYDCGGTDHCNAGRDNSAHNNRDCTQTSSQIKQVEINLSSVVGIHVAQELAVIHDRIKGKSRPKPNNTRLEFALAIEEMDRTFRTKYQCTENETTSVLYISAKEETNFVEMMHVVEELRNHGLSVIQTDFDTIVDTYLNYPSAVEVVGNQRFLTINKSYGFSDRLDMSGMNRIDGSFLALNSTDSAKYISKVSVIYFRTGYDPKQYTTDGHWEFRQFIEDTNCIVIPSAISQLVGLKKVQQLWCTDLEKLSERFGHKELTQLRSYFADQVDVDDCLTDNKTKDMIHEAIHHPDRFVLKPQREGGGNNYYDSEIPKILNQNLKLGSSYILMRKIYPTHHQAVFFREGKFEAINSVISEIGIYTASLWDGDKEMFNKSIGSMARTKSTSHNEGGVSIGAAVYDTLTPV